MLLTVLIGIGLTAASQSKTIADNQLKQVRLLENQARHDSAMLLENQVEIDSLYIIIKYQETKLQNAETIKNFKNEKIELLEQLVANEKDKYKISETFNSMLTRKIRNRNLIILSSAIINMVFIIKSVK